VADDGIDQNLYLYNAPLLGDWTYWDCIARNPSPLARDLWVIDSGNDTALLADFGSGRLAGMKDQNGDYNLYLYNCPIPGDWTYWDAAARNPSPMARDFWAIPRGDDAAAMCGVDTTGDGESDSLLVVRNEYGDDNVYLWNMPVPGDWTYWDAVSRNPSPLARDFWVIPQRDATVGVTGIQRGASIDELGVMENLDTDYNFYIWNVPIPGDWTYWDAAARNPSPLARDLWKIPSRGPSLFIAAPRWGGASPTPIP
jgi:hypothetical protein